MTEVPAIVKTELKFTSRGLWLWKGMSKNMKKNLWEWSGATQSTSWKVRETLWEAWIEFEVCSSQVYNQILRLMFFDNSHCYPQVKVNSFCYTFINFWAFSIHNWTLTIHIKDLRQLNSLKSSKITSRSFIFAGFYFFPSTFRCTQIINDKKPRRDEEYTMRIEIETRACAIKCCDG